MGIKIIASCLWIIPGLLPSNAKSVDRTVAVISKSIDITRHAAEALISYDLIRDKFGTLLNEALSAPSASLALPPTVHALGVNLSTANFVTIDGRPTLVVEGTLPAVTGVLLNL